MTFSITVHDHVLVAHTLTGAVFGPAQRRHGATYVVEATFRRAALGPAGIVADLGAAAGLLADVLEPLRYRDLDTVPELAGLITTTEVLAQVIGDRLADRIRAGALREDGTAIGALSVTLHESPIASASYERAL